jgi:hypothetical protein
VRGHEFDLLTKRWPSSLAELKASAAQNYERLALGLEAVPITRCRPGPKCNWFLRWARLIGYREPVTSTRESRARERQEAKRVEFTARHSIAWREAYRERRIAREEAVKRATSIGLSAHSPR